MALKRCRSSAASASRSGAGGRLQPAGAQVGDGRDLLDRDRPAGRPLDVAEQAQLARLGERDRDALAPGPADAADAVDVGVGRRRHVVVDDVGQLVDVETACGDVGGDEQLGGAVAQAPHHPVAALLVHPAVQRFGPVAASVERLGELVDLGARAAEDDRRGRRLDVEDPSERRRLVGSRHDVGPLGDERHGVAGGGPLDLDAHRVAQVAPGDGVDARRQGRREQHGLAIGGRGAEDRLDVVGEAHVEHLVGLVEHDHADAVEPQRAAIDVVDRPAGRGDDDVHAVAQGAELAADRLAAVDRQHPARRARGRSGRSPRTPARRARASARARGRRAAAGGRSDRPAAAPAGRTRRSCRCPWPPGRARRGRRGSAGWRRAGSASAPRSRAR